MPMHTEVCIGLDIAHFPSLMYGFIMQQVHLHRQSVFCTLSTASIELYTVEINAQPNHAQCHLGVGGLRVLDLYLIRAVKGS